MATICGGESRLPSDAKIWRLKIQYLKKTRNSSLETAITIMGAWVSVNSPASGFMPIQPVRPLSYLSHQLDKRNNFQPNEVYARVAKKSPENENGENLDGKNAQTPREKVQKFPKVKEGQKALKNQSPKSVKGSKLSQTAKP